MLAAYLEDAVMATGWAGDGAVQDQIDATVGDAIRRARSRLPQGPGRERCEECDAPIPEARRAAMPAATASLRPISARLSRPPSPRSDRLVPYFPFDSVS